MKPEFEARALTRRQALAASASTTAALVLAACGAEEPEGTVGPGEERLERTPACDEDAATPEQTAGPFFLPGSPQRASLLEAGVEGTTLVLAGRVLGPDCRPLPGALLDFWQADDGGVYDTRGDRLRGHQFASGDGSYRLVTIVPGVYPGRTRHIHVRAQPRGGAVLTTQLYFPGEAANDGDGIYDPALVIAAREEDDRVRGLFDFVL